MPEQRSKTFGRDTFSRFAQKHGIEVAVEPLDTFRLMPSDKLKEAKNFNVMMRMGPRILNITISFPEYRRSLPPVDDILEYMANEAKVSAIFGDDAEAFARFTGITVDRASRNLQDSRAAAEAFGAFLGPEAYRELIAITEARGPLPG